MAQQPTPKQLQRDITRDTQKANRLSTELRTVNQRIETNWNQLRASQSGGGGTAMSSARRT